MRKSTQDMREAIFANSGQFDKISTKAEIKIPCYENTRHSI